MTMYAEMRAVERLSPEILRLTFSGGTLNEFGGSEATDAYINAPVVPEGSPITIPFEQQDLDDLPPEHRPRPRRFTIREWNERTHMLVIDFVVHGDSGYAGSWAQRAKRPSPQADWHLLVGDESAFGAIGASLQSLPSTAQALVFALVERPGSEIEFPSSADVDVTWLYREGAVGAETVLLDAVRSAVFPLGDFDVFVHGEAAEVRALRQHLVDERHVDPDNASISAYWRRNHTDEDWRKIKRDLCHHGSPHAGTSRFDRRRVRSWRADLRVDNRTVACNR